MTYQTLLHNPCRATAAVLMVIPAEGMQVQMTAVKIVKTAVQALVAQVLHLRVQVLLCLQRITAGRKDVQRSKAPRCRQVLRKASLWRVAKDCARHSEFDEYVVIQGQHAPSLLLLPEPVVSVTFSCC